MKASRRYLPSLLSAVALAACGSGGAPPRGTNLATLVSSNSCTVRAAAGGTAVDVEFGVLYVSPEPDPPRVEIEVAATGEVSATSTATLDQGITRVTVRLPLTGAGTARTYQQRIAIDAGEAVAEFDESERDNGLVVLVPVPAAPRADTEVPCRFVHPGDPTPPPVEPANPVVLDLASSLAPAIPAPGARFTVRLAFTNRSTLAAGPVTAVVTIQRTDGRGPREAFRDTLAIGGLARSTVAETAVERGLPTGGYSLHVEIRPAAGSNVRPRTYPDRPFAI
ncbi:hypothetical protein RB614_37330 [Phytohabitans sp. ZYX-F-186]|uniref:CARDB domain-containing protein n=1 Tax=Phytohabitans maris TaxID=3071409 RepID=A0ABU0ZT06_9ACTN|nr:hypothetical protein [Phytohabitans sp. ZYX-F-186]MDQ7910173.1 hypothetical protein [Phytohabitans sp. ZYX-F-186]